MFLQKNIKRVGSKTYRSALIVESFREGKNVRKRIIANVSKLPPYVIDSIGEALKGKTASVKREGFQTESGKSFGGLWAIKKIAEELFISKALGDSKKALLVIIMICGRILTQGSRRHLKFWKDGQSIEEVFGISNFDEDDLYEALDWLESRQEKIEKRLFKLRYKNEKVRLFLYDITSSYLEGECNELAEFGYNRDQKRGKKQIVIGLLTDKKGFPIAVEIFKGNTMDCTTVPKQVQKLANRFGVEDVIFVGDRGMVKKAGIESLQKKEWHYITAITKPQMEKLIRKNVFQLELFDEKLVEVEHEKIRYILRRNPVRVKEIRKNRNERISKVKKHHKELNDKLAKKPRSQVETALNDLEKIISRLKLTKIFTVKAENRTLTLNEDQETLRELSSLDGCYVIKTDIEKKELNKEEAHAVYKNLSFVEWSFRMMKTGFLEIRPLFHRKANRTRACASVAMFSYMILHHVFKRCKELKIPLEPLIEKLDQIQTQRIKIADQWITILPSNLRSDQQDILEALNLALPKSLPNKTKNVARKSQRPKNQ
jgi:transposase